MGVQGLTRFVQQHYPHIIHKLPNRLKDLAGKRLVIDGTLITQRLHFAPSPHPFRHVLGWYNLAREMNDHGISAVCIFDGQKRNKAKALEQGRRQENRRLDVSRGTLEILRHKRLGTLQTVMTNIRSLDDKGKSTVAEMLSRLNPSDGTGTVGTSEGLYRVGKRLRVLSKELPLSPDEPSDETLVPVESTELDIHAEPDVGAQQHPLSSPQDTSFTGLGPPQLGIPAAQPSPSLEDMKASLLNSYRDFRTSISRVASMPLPVSTSKTTTPSFAPADVISPQDDLVLSKAQCELTLEEGRVWDELTLATTTAATTTATTISADDIAVGVPSSADGAIISPAIAAPPDIVSTVRTLPALALDNLMYRAAENRLDALKTRSGPMVDSYQRRMCAPTQCTYFESKEILEAMGVLCYEVEGEQEAEALASSLVLDGLADYVVSEDSDVLVYQVPLIRNISSRSEPLILIHGSDVRNVLGLSKEAYIDFALLLGTDFSQRIKNIGPSRAFKFIKEFGTIENVVDSQSKYQPQVSRAEYLAQVDSARTIFGSPPSVPESLAVSMMPTGYGFGVVDRSKVNVIIERCGLGKALMADASWDFEAALAGNYFRDNPTVLS